MEDQRLTALTELPECKNEDTKSSDSVKRLRTTTYAEFESDEQEVPAAPVLNSDALKSSPAPCSSGSTSASNELGLPPSLSSAVKASRALEVSTESSDLLELKGTVQHLANGSHIRRTVEDFVKNHQAKLFTRNKAYTHLHIAVRDAIINVCIDLYPHDNGIQITSAVITTARAHIISLFSDLLKDGAARAVSREHFLWIISREVGNKDPKVWHGQSFQKLVLRIMTDTILFLTPEKYRLFLNSHVLSDTSVGTAVRNWTSRLSDGHRWLVDLTIAPGVLLKREYYR